MPVLPGNTVTPIPALDMKKFNFCTILFFSFIILSAAEKPLLRAGLITDTHVTPRVQSVNKLRAALKLFRAQKVDVVINLGDVAEKFHYEAYRHYRNTVKAVYPRGIREIFAYANHDVNPGMPDLPRPVTYGMVKKALEITHDPVDVVVIKGVVFVTLPESLHDLQAYESHIAAAAAKYPGKPLFVIDHRPPHNTSYNTLVWCKAGKHEVLKKFPQVINLSGHVHNDIRNELCLWQGEYTSIDTGCISGWAGDLEGVIPFGKSSAGVLIMDVFADKVIFHRMDCQTGKVAAEPWRVPLPHDPQNPPLSFARRKESSKAPEFPAGSKLKALFHPQKFNRLYLRFDAAQPQKDTFKYEIFFKDKNSCKVVNRMEIFGDFFRNETVKKSGHAISAGYFDDGREYIVEVVPFNFFGKRGKGMKTEFKAPAKVKFTTVFECRDPMKVLKFKSGLAGGEELPVKNGFYQHNVEEARLLLPAGVWQGKKGTRFRFTVDMHTKQGDTEKWTLVLRNPKPEVNARARLYTQNGDVGVRRYVIEFTKMADEYDYYFLVREGAAGEVRFDYVKIEKLN